MSCSSVWISRHVFRGRATRAADPLIDFNGTGDPHHARSTGPARLQPRPEKSADNLHTHRGVASGVTRKRVGSRAQFTSNKRASPRDLPRTRSREASSLGLEYARPRPQWARLGSPFLRRLLTRASTHSPQVHLHRHTRRALDLLDGERMQLDLCYEEPTKIREWLPVEYQNRELNMVASQHRNAVN